MFTRRFQRQTIAAAVLLPALCAGARADCFEHHGSRFSLDPALLRAIARVESSGRPDAINNSHRTRTGSIDVGLMQINSAWLPRLARHGIAADELSDPCTSIEVGAWILSDLVQRLGNTWEAVGAYNAACSTLKGADCSRARASYAWKVFRQLRTMPPQRTDQSSPAQPSPSPTPAGLMSLAATATTAVTAPTAESESRQ